jgi:uncharacterized membrane protein YhiD involved in acid resistance
VRRDTVRGLTTAAIVWVTAAIGMACGAGLLVLAVVVTAGHFVVVLLYPRQPSPAVNTSSGCENAPVISVPSPNLGWAIAWS